MNQIRVQKSNQQQSRSGSGFTAGYEGNISMIRLEKINTGNVWETVKLSVHETQKCFVATNTQSILEAYVTVAEGKVAQPFSIYAQDTLAGFLMIGYDYFDDGEEPQAAHGNYLVWRLMIDQKYQGQGFGKAALNTALEYIRTRPFGDAEYCWLSYEPENIVAKSLYASVGFVENGERCGEETVAVLKL